MEPPAKSTVSLYSDNLVEFERKCKEVNSADLFERISHLLLYPAHAAFGKEVVTYEKFEVGYEEYLMTMKKVHGTSSALFFYLLTLPFSGPCSLFGAWMRKRSFSHQREYMRILRQSEEPAESMNIRKKLWYDATRVFQTLKPYVRNLNGKASFMDWNLVSIQLPHPDGALIVGGMPLVKDKGFLLKKCMIQAVLSVMEDWENDGQTGPYLCDKPISPKEWLDEGVEHFQVYARDWRPLSVQKIDQGVDFIRYYLEKGHRVLVHCNLGMNRSPLIVMGYMMKYCRLQPYRALNILRKERSETFLHPLQYESAEKYYDELCQ